MRLRQIALAARDLSTTVDTLCEVLGIEVAFNDPGVATFGLEKTAEGLQAIQWYREGKMLEIAEYCCYDVKLTKLVHEYGAVNRQLFYKNRFGAKLSVGVEW